MSSATGAAHGKYNHPWLQPLSPGKTRIYNFAHKSVVTALIAFSAYAFYEVGRGSYFILKSNAEREAAKQAGGTGDGNLQWKVQWQVQGTGSVRWTPYDRSDAIKRAAREEAGWTQAGFDQRYADLVAVLPDLPRVLPKLAPDTLVRALAAPEAVGLKLIELKAELPSTNVGAMLLLHPKLLDIDTAAIVGGLAEVRVRLGSAATAEEAVQWYPALLEPEILRTAMEQLERLVPQLLKTAKPKDLIHALGVVMGSSAAVRLSNWPDGWTE